MGRPNKKQLKRRRRALARRKLRLQNDPATLTVLTPHPCDGCTACCMCVGVEELRKPYYSSCSFCDGTRCITYENRPPSCAGYECAYAAGVVVNGLITAEFCFLPRCENDFEFLPCTKSAQMSSWTAFLSCLTLSKGLPAWGPTSTEWNSTASGQKYRRPGRANTIRLKTMGWGDPDAAFQAHFAVRTDHEEEDELWWCRAVDKYIKNRNRAASRMSE